ncbi:hypothetical protein MHUMG1_07655 [Metarhizium humberi]|uniref:Cytochrome P450 n=1 Tax=Metarhizium humberi TaxID=2596975 RepID=A0A9P8MA34_9HYPO|nr:hypothetical protein MHUMG1_07655 [Metarhizium humberi]
MYLNDDTFGSSATSLTSLAVVIFITLSLYCFYVRELTSLRNVPGPFFANLDLHEKYGPIVRVSSNEVIVSSTKSRHVIYGATSKFPKGDWYIPTGSAGWSDGDELDFLSELDMDKYRLQRRLVGPAYTDNFMRQIEGNLDKILERNIEIMIQRAGRIEDVDHVANFLASGMVLSVRIIRGFFHSCDLDCLQVATFGESKGLLEAGVDDGAIQLTMNLWGYMHWVGYVPVYHRAKKWFNMIVKPKLCIILAILPSLPTRKTTMHSKPASQMTEHVFVWARKRIRDRFDSFASQKLPTQATDISTRLLQIHAEKPALKPHWVAEMLGTNFGAGVETTAITISSFLDFVISHPGCQEKVQKEIDEAREAGKLSKLPKLREIESLPYLSACLNESKRLHPVVGSPLQRVVPHGGIELEGKWLPAGTAVGINPWVMGRNKSLFGADADAFRPERWFEMSREQWKACGASGTSNFEQGAAAFIDGTMLESCTTGHSKTNTIGIHDEAPQSQGPVEEKRSCEEDGSRDTSRDVSGNLIAEHDLCH